MHFFIPKKSQKKGHGADPTEYPAGRRPVPGVLIYDGKLMSAATTVILSSISFVMALSIRSPVSTRVVPVEVDGYSARACQSSAATARSRSS